MPTILETLFPHCLPINPTAPEPQRADFPQIPAKPAVYLLTTDHNPEPQSSDIKTHSVLSPQHSALLLATTADLRAALKRRLADTPPDVKSKRIPYAQIATRIYYRPVFSAFAANFHYAHAARQLFPDTADALAPWAAPTATWFLAVERPGTTNFPRIRKTNSLTDPTAKDMLFAGPIRDKHAANRLVELLEDLFDLCRYHHILLQAPHGKPCAYKEMGKCPAPCDGSIPLSQYHQQIQAAWDFLTNAPTPQAQGLQSLGLRAPTAREAWHQNIEQQMKSAATQLHFETANRLKQRLTRAAAIDHEAFAHITPIDQFAFLALQPGQTRSWIEPWLITLTPGTHGVSEGTAPIENQKSKIENPIIPLPQFHRKNLPAAAQELATQITQLQNSPLSPQSSPLSTSSASTIALVAHHLFSPKPTGVFLRLSDLAASQDSASHILHAAESLWAKPTAESPLPEQASDGEATPLT